MTVFSHVLKIIFLLIFLFLLYLATTSYLPCTSYPSAYLQAREIGEKIRTFQNKHKRLPDFSNQADVVALGLNAGHLIQAISDNGSYVIDISPDTAKNFTYSVNQTVQPGFDNPWVTYNPSNESITCGHR